MTMPPPSSAPDSLVKRHGGKVLADHLAAFGQRVVFSVPGESFLAALDGLYDHAIEVVTARQEGAATMMAEAYAKATGQTGVAFVTRGPGASNAAAGLHVAMHDATPMVVFVGQIPLAHRDRAAFQEVDYRAFFGPLVKWVAEVEQTARLPEYIARAFSIAHSGRKGPVVLALPEDILSADCTIPDLPRRAMALAGARAEDLRAILTEMAQANAPLIIAGGSGWSAQASADLEALSLATGLPVATSFRRQDYIDNRHPHFAGWLGVGACPSTQQALAQADAILALGTRLGDTPTGGFSLLDPARPHPRLFHIHPDPDEIGRLWRAEIGIAAQPEGALADLRALPDLPRHDASRAQALHRAYRDWQKPAPTIGALRLENVMTLLSDHLPPEAIVTNGAGNYAAFLHRYFAYRRFGAQLAPTSGSMGYGLPAAIAAKLAHPDRPVICIAGDGCLQMVIGELSTAAQYGLDLVVIIANNGRYGTIRMHQEKTYPNRVIGTDLFNPDYTQLAAAYGGTGHKITEDADFLPALTRALQGGLHLIELCLDRRMLSTAQNLSKP